MSSILGPAAIDMINERLGGLGVVFQDHLIISTDECVMGVDLVPSALDVFLLGVQEEFHEPSVGDESEVGKGLLAVEFHSCRVDLQVWQKRR